MMNMNKIGQKIRDLRRKNDLTQEKLADFLGVPYQSVSKWECGVTAPGFTKDDVLEHCLRGEALREHRQKRLETVLHRLVVLTGQCARDKLQAIRLCEEILRLFFPDGNCLEFHCNLAELAYEKAVLYLREQRYDDAVCALKEYKEHAVLADKADVHAEELRYTSPYFDLLTLPPYLLEESYTPSYRETFALQMQDKIFDPLRNRADFRAIPD